MGYSFVFQNQKYEIVDEHLDDLVDVDGDGEYGVRLVQSHACLSKKHYVTSKGLETEEMIDKHFEIYGANIFELPLPTFLDLLKKQFMGPIVMFQLFCSVLWALDTYWISRDRIVFELL